MKLLDLFCGAGGCAEGYHRAGFEVVGVDHEPQKHYPFEFHQDDALAYCLEHADEFDVIHASPPCKAFTKTGWAIRFGYRDKHPDLLTPTRNMLDEIGKPYVIENVPDAPMRGDIILCGSMFGLGVRRHRLFETKPLLFALVPACQHPAHCVSVFGKPKAAGDAAKWGPAMGIDWMTTAELSQAIPPAYTEFIGRSLMKIIA